MKRDGRRDASEPLVVAPAEGDDVGWLITFADLVMQLFAFVLVAAVCGGATHQLAAKPAAPTVVASAPDENDPSARARDEHPPAPDDALTAFDGNAWAAEDVTAPADVTERDTIRGAVERPAPAATRARALGGYLAAFVAARGDGGDASVSSGDADVRLAFGGRLGFATGSADLLPHGRTLLHEVQRLASATPDLTIEVSGYTDDVPIHTRDFPSNLELSLARAARVAHEIARDDPALAVRTVTLGYAEHQAIAPNDGPENRARNRRVEVRLIDHSMP